MLFLIRLLPLCEPNYNLVELGPRGTGKSYAYQELSPYVILLTGPTTVANLFYNMATGKMGLVGIWDAIAFDEVADLQKMPKEVVTTLKTYCESGMFARGKDALTGSASIAMFGNTNQPVEVMVRSSHLFVPMPDVIREDMAFLDRIHYYIPGWEIPKMRVEFFTDHYGFVVDYLAEALRELRKHNFTEVIDRHFSLGSHLNARDVKGPPARRSRAWSSSSTPTARSPGTSWRNWSRLPWRVAAGSKNSSRRWARSSTTRPLSRSSTTRPARSGLSESLNKVAGR